MDLAADTLVIPAWANGPDGSGNGGWTAGLLARRLDAPAVVVTLRAPPPIGRELQVVRGEGSVELRDGELLVAHAAGASLQLEAPDQVRGVSPGEAHEASSRFPFGERHPFPRCLVCGTDRAPDTPAFNVHCGRLDDVRVGSSPVFADTWRPAANLADRDEPGLVAHEAAWAALDCPSAAPVADPDAPAVVLARIAARVCRRPRIGEVHVLAAWHLASDGRKHQTRSAMIARGGEVIGVAEALWIEVRPR